MFDSQVLKKKLLGVVSLRVGSVIDLAVGGDGESYMCSHRSNNSLNETEMVTRDLGNSKNNSIVKGKLILMLSSNLKAQGVSHVDGVAEKAPPYTINA